MLIFKKNLVILLLGVCFSLPTNAQAQKKTKVTLDLKDVTLNEVIEELKKQTDYDFFYNSELAKSKGKISVEAKNKEVKQLLDEILPKLGLEYAISQSLISIREKKIVELIRLSGKVTDDKGNPIPGATVIIHGQPKELPQMPMDGTRFLLDLTMFYEFLSSVTNRKSLLSKEKRPWM